jgi:serine protease Do
MVRRRFARVPVAPLVLLACLVAREPAARADESPEDTAFMAMAWKSQGEVIRKVLPTVVNILAHARPSDETSSMNAAAPGASDSFEYKSSAGSGFVVDPNGTIMTNWHVVAGAYEIFVTFADGRRYEAQIVNAARLVDLALLKIDAGHPLQAVTWADSDKAQIGDTVLAIGNPLGIGTTVTRGIVSALHRNISDTPYDDFIQTDAALNHGNSGGPLFDAKGDVLGVDSALISPTTANAGLGFALPSNEAIFVVKQLMTYGWVRPGWLGVKIQDVTPDIAHAMHLQDQHGSVVAWVSPDGPAAAAGLKVGDVVTRFQDDTPGDERALLRDIAAGQPGQRVALGVLRAGKPIVIEAILREWPRMAWEAINAPLKVTPPHWVIPADLGIRATTLTEQLKVDEGMPSGVRGALVTDVAHGTDAARRGLAPGDVVLQVGDARVDDDASLFRLISAARAAGEDMAMFLIFPKDKGSSAFPSPKWIPLRLRAG